MLQLSQTSLQSTPGRRRANAAAACCAKNGADSQALAAAEMAARSIAQKGPLQKALQCRALALAKGCAGPAGFSPPRPHADTMGTGGRLCAATGGGDVLCSALQARCTEAGREPEPDRCRAARGTPQAAGARALDLDQDTYHPQRLSRGTLRQWSTCGCRMPWPPTSQTGQGPRSGAPLTLVRDDEQRRAERAPTCGSTMRGQPWPSRVAQAPVVDERAGHPGCCCVPTWHRWICCPEPSREGSD